MMVYTYSQCNVPQKLLQIYRLFFYNTNICENFYFAVKLLFERVPNTDNQFYLRRSNSKLYACMSRRGKLRIQVSG